MKLKISAALISIFLLAGCSVYTFSGSSLPGHLKTVDVPLFANVSLQPEVAEAITTELTRRVLADNVLKVVSGNGDATLAGTVRGYSNGQYVYDVQEARTATVSQYIVRLTVDVVFTDNKKNEPLYQATLTGQGIYKADTETESDGRSRAVADVVDKILQNSVQSW